MPPKTGEPSVVMLPRVAGRISFCYVDACQVRRNEFGVTARIQTKEHGTEEVELPVAKFAALLLGPGTSITQPAISMTAKSGCAIVCVGKGAVGATAVALPKGQSSKWLELQVKAWADPKRRKEIAIQMYKKRFAMDPGDVSISTLRGLEGARVKKRYRELARQHKVSFKRAYRTENWGDADPINRAMSAGNHMLYGVVQSAMAAMGVHPGLGFIHTGTDRSFVFDVADLYKLTHVVPSAFKAHDAENPELFIRVNLRKELKLFRLLSKIIPDIQTLFDPTAKTPAAAPDPITLWDPDHGTLPGGLNYDEEPF